MMDYQRYKKTRDLSWQILLDSGTNKLPVKVTAICRQQGIVVLSFQKGRNILAGLGLTERCAANDGFSVAFRGKRMIFFNEKCSPTRCRFTIGHELGHFIAGHIGGDPDELRVTAINREPSPGDDPRETEANVFASRILAPACVLWGLGIHSAEDISKACDISLQSAQFRAERMRQLYDREQDFLKTRGKSCFCLSDMERKVYEQFRPYIENNRVHYK